MVTLRGLTIGASPSALLQLPQAQVRLSIESLWRWAPVVRRITLTQPQVTLANHRGDQVKAYLVSKLPAERVLLAASKVGVEGLVDDKAPTTRVQFAVK